MKWEMESVKVSQPVDIFFYQVKMGDHLLKVKGAEGGQN